MLMNYAFTAFLAQESRTSDIFFHVDGATSRARNKNQGLNNVQPENPNVRSQLSPLTLNHRLTESLNFNDFSRAALLTLNLFFSSSSVYSRNKNICVGAINVKIEKKSFAWGH